MMFCDMLVNEVLLQVAEVTYRCLQLSCTQVLALIPKFGSQPGLGIISFQFIQTFDQNFVLLAEHHYLQTLSDVIIASFPSLPKLARFLRHIVMQLNKVCNGNK